MVLSLLNSHKNFIINLKYLRKFQKIVNQNNDEFLPDYIHPNLKFNAESTIRRTENFTKIFEHCLRYFPEKTQMVINSNGVLLDSVKKLGQKNSDEQALWQIEHTMTQSLSFLKDYVVLTNLLGVHINNYLEFYNKHQKFVIENIAQITENIEHPDYQV